MPIQRLLIAAMAAGVLLLAGATIFALRATQISHDAYLADSLTALRDATHNGVEVWSRERQTDASIWADSPEVRQLTVQLLEAKRSKQALIDSPAQTRLRSWLRPIRTRKGYQGFFIIAPDNTNLASTRDENVGARSLLTKQDIFFKRIWNGLTAMSTPQPSDVPLADATGKEVEGLPTMFAGAPIRDASGEIIAALAFRIDPAKDFTALLRTTWTGETGETFAFDSTGRLISDSRFEQKLRDLGLLSPDSRAILTLDVHEPAAITGARDSRSITDKPASLTRMAERALSGRPGVDVEGYTGYTGTEVVGAWLWDSDLGLGIATEMSAKEAHKPHRRMVTLVLFFAAFSALLLAGLGMVFAWGRKKIAESEKYYRHLVEGSVQGICIHQDERIVYANEAYARMHGYELGEIANSDITRLIFEEDIAKFREKVNARFRGENRVERYELRGRRKDGSVVWLDALPRLIDWKGRPATQATLVDITQRKLIEHNLLESEQRFKDFAESASDWLWEMGQDLRFTYLSEQFFERYPIAPDQIIGQSREDVTQDTTDELFQRHLDDLRNHRPFRNFQYHTNLPDGREVLFSMSGRPIFDQTGAFLGYRGTGTDVTRQKIAEEASRANEERLRTIVENVADGIVTIDQMGTIQSFNRSASSIFSYAAEEVIGNNVSMLMPEPHRTNHDGYLAQYRATGEGKIIGGGPNDVVGVRRDGKPVQLELTVGAVEAETGNIFIVTLRDISQRKRAEQSIRESHEAQRALNEILHISLESVSLKEQLGRALDQIMWVPWLPVLPKGGIFLVEGEGEVLTLKVHKNFGKPLLEKCNKIRFGECLCGRAAQTGEIQHARCIDERHEIRYEGIVGHGHYNVPIVFADKVLGVIVLYLEEGHQPDIREVSFLEAVANTLAGMIKRKQSEDTQVRLERQLQQSHKMEAIGTLAGGIAHDVNNTLVPIFGLTELMLEDTDSDSLEHDNLAMIKTAAERVRDLVGQILMFSREGGEQEQMAEIDAMIAETLPLLRATIPTTIDIRSEIDATSALIPVGSTHFHQIVLNLAANASHAMERGGRLEIATEQLDVDRAFLEQHPSVDLEPGRYARLTIKDNGCGMDKKTMSRIFDPFFTTRDVGEGTGMGLSVVHGIVTACGGTVTVSSELGEGTTMEVYFPVVACRNSGEQELSRSPDGNAVLEGVK